MVTAPAYAAVRPGVAMPPLDAWLHRHQSLTGFCMTSVLVARFEGPAPTLAALRARVGERWAPLERMRLVPGPAGSGWPAWDAVPELDVDAHVGTAPGGSVPALATRLLAEPLGADAPPWRLVLAPEAGGFALLLCSHHALLDGVSLFTLVRSLLDAPPGAPAALPRPAPVEPPRGPLSHLRALADLLPRARQLPFHGPVDERRAAHWTRLSPTDLAAARAALPAGRTSARASVPSGRAARAALPGGRASANAVFLTAVAGALASAGLAGRSVLPTACAMVPVDVRGPHEPELLGNRYATVRVPLPLDPDPVRRLRKLDARTRRPALRRRAEAQARLVSSRPQRDGRLSALLGRYADSPRYSSLLCSSVALHGPPLLLGDARLADLAVLPPLSPGHPLALTMMSYGGAAVLTAVTDHGHRELAALLPALVRQEIRALGR
jgi:diacylglycerol O-acyltransferase